MHLVHVANYVAVDNKVRGEASQHMLIATRHCSEDNLAFLDILLADCFDFNSQFSETFFLLGCQVCKQRVWQIKNLLLSDFPQLLT